MKESGKRDNGSQVVTIGNMQEIMTVIDKNNNYHYILDEIFKFILSGPSIFGWIVGILHYPVKSPEFLVGFQNGITSILFSFLYALFYVASLFFNFPSEAALTYIASVLSLSYLLAATTLYIYYRKNRPAPGSMIAQSLLDRLFDNPSKSDRKGAHSSVG